MQKIFGLPRDTILGRLGDCSSLLPRYKALKFVANSRCALSDTGRNGSKFSIVEVPVTRAMSAGVVISPALTLSRGFTHSVKARTSVYANRCSGVVGIG